MQFKPPQTGKEQDESTDFQPKFDDMGLVSAIVCDYETNEVLMFAFMNALAIQKTLESGEAHFWSRSRNELWHKGATSGNVQKVHEIRTDCDQDALVLKVEVVGPQASCHTGRVSCFYRVLEKENDEVRLRFDKRAPKFDPDTVYKK